MSTFHAVCVESAGWRETPLKSGKFTGDARGSLIPASFGVTVLLLGMAETTSATIVTAANSHCYLLVACLSIYVRVRNALGY